MAEWFGPTEKLPRHNEKILLREGETTRVAIYDAQKRIFKLSKGGSNPNTEIKWMMFPKEKNSAKA